MNKFLLGIDIGTSACKVALFNLDGQVIAQSTKGYKLYQPKKNFIEQDANEWWQSVCAATKEIASNKNIDLNNIVGIGIDGQSWSTLPVDKDGNTLTNAMIWMDKRASKECDDVRARGLEKEIFDVCGNLFDPTYTTPKILWIKNNMPEVFEKTFKFLQSNSFIAYKLTGNMTQDLSQGYGLHCFDIRNGIWSEKICNILGIPKEKLPNIYKCDDVIGQVSEKASLECGLPEGIPVVAGGLDAACGTLGAGVIFNGQTQEQGGQAAGMSICMDEPVAHEKLILSNHVIPHSWLLQGGTVGGGSLKWFKEKLGDYEEHLSKTTGENTFDLLVNEASKVNPGSEGVIFLPYMAGERSPIWDKNAKGVFYGLDFGSTKGHMIRATLEGVAYSLNHNLLTAEEVNINISELIAMGGAANSTLWTQIKSDITGKSIKVPSSDTATTLGAALLAGVGTGVYKDYTEAVEKTVRITKEYKPNMENHEVYKKYYQIYLDLYNNLKETFIKSGGIE